jgi:hypothetical protein
MLRKFIAAATIAGALLVPNVADASVKGAQRAVKREVKWDYNKSIAVDCYRHGQTRYVCDFGFWSYGELINGAARVKQSGNRYTVNYRIYW